MHLIMVKHLWIMRRAIQALFGRVSHNHLTPVSSLLQVWRNCLDLYGLGHVAAAK